MNDIIAVMSDHRPPTIERHCDVAVIGGSAAGLAAALQLARQRRSVIVVDAGDPRNAPAAHMHGYLGHEGLPPLELTAIGREEVRSYGGEILAGRASGVTRTDGDRFRVDLVGGHCIVARRVLAATGLSDELPDIDGVAEHWGATSSTARSATDTRSATSESSRSSPTRWDSTRSGCSATSAPSSPLSSTSLSTWKARNSTLCEQAAWRS